MISTFDLRTTILEIVYQTSRLSTIFQWKGNHPIITPQEISKSQIVLNDLKNYIAKFEQQLTQDIVQEIIQIQLPEIETKFTTLDFEELRNTINNWCHQRDWEQYHTPRNLVMAMIGEVGELTEIFLKGEYLPGLLELNEQEIKHTGEELADILHNLIRLSDRCNIDLVKAIQQKIIKNTIKYPIEKVKGSSLKYNEY